MYHLITFIHILCLHRYNNLNKVSYRKFENCDKTNQQRQFDCIQRYIISKLNCTPPWLIKYSDGNINNCPASNLVDQFIDIQMKMLKNEAVDELKAFGCLKENCIDNSWKAEVLSLIDQVSLENNPFLQPFTSPYKTTIMFGVLSDEVRDMLLKITKIK